MERKELISKIYEKENKLQFGEELQKILNIYTDNEWTSEPLDGDEVDNLVEHIRNQLNLLNGNITEREYEKLEK